MFTLLFGLLLLDFCTFANSADVTQPPGLGTGFLGYISTSGVWSTSNCPSSGSFATFAPTPGTATFARCCDPNLNTADCPAVTGCSGSVLFGENSQLTCSSEQSCFTGIIYGNYLATTTAPLTDIGCGAGDWTLYRNYTPITVPTSTTTMIGGSTISSAVTSGICVCNCPASHDCAVGVNDVITAVLSTFFGTIFVADVYSGG
ncbi:hypothetical protein K432DRAFT_447830 [Lepidopterella palustris CBS 459.81]|uniref:Uncharacterized protein n=1 Tax=Lepidopterella palustris CBS 459.81 TaxID=1314670 RepID=A0A8E2DXC6_9PEZI|nr:hypothetical protein K432DRAFT_447830 [Lepidopterella palustris CBS 459.81]